eukprot:Sdes_comp19025_c0_seq1m9583
MGESEEEEVELSFLVDQMKIFWPQSFDFSPSGFGFLVGFFLDPFTICISCILQNVDASQISACLNQLETSSKENHSNFKKFCNASPILLGIFASPDISKSIFLGKTTEKLFYPPFDFHCDFMASQNNLKTLETQHIGLISPRMKQTKFSFGKPIDMGSIIALSNRALLRIRAYRITSSSL